MRERVARLVCERRPSVDQVVQHLLGSNILIHLQVKLCTATIHDFCRLLSLRHSVVSAPGPLFHQELDVLVVCLTRPLILIPLGTLVLRVAPLQGTHRIVEARRLFACILFTSICLTLSRPVPARQYESVLLRRLCAAYFLLEGIVGLLHFEHESVPRFRPWLPWRHSGIRFPSIQRTQSYEPVGR